MGFAGFTASETARRCGPAWRSSWRSKVSSRTEVRVLNLSRHLNSPGGPSLSSAAKAGQFLAYRSTRRNPFARPASARGPSRCLWGESDKPLSLPRSRPSNISEAHPGGPSYLPASVAHTSLVQGAWSAWPKYASAGCYFVAECNDARRASSLSLELSAARNRKALRT